MTDHFGEKGEGAEVAPPLPPVFFLASSPAETAGLLVARNAQCLGVGERVSAAGGYRGDMVRVPLAVNVGQFD